MGEERFDVYDTEFDYDVHYLHPNYRGFNVPRHHMLQTMSFSAAHTAWRVLYMTKCINNIHNFHLSLNNIKLIKD